MPSSLEGTARSWVAVGPPSLLDMLVPLRDEHARRGPAELLSVESEHIESFLRTYRGERTTFLVVECTDQPTVRDRFQSPMLRTREATLDGVVGWLRLERQELAAYARRAATLLTRQRDDDTTFVLLAPRERRYLELLDELEPAARLLGLIPLRWSAERIRAAPLIQALRLGAAAVLYTGHGNPRGWFAYGGVTAQMIADGDPWSSDQTNAVVFSLSCSTGKANTGARGRDARRAFSDDIIAGGVAGAVLAPFKDPLHAHSRALARAIVEAIAVGTASLCDILQHLEQHGCSLDGYAVVGDPALPVRPSVGSADRGAGVYAPPADAVLATSPRWG